MKTRPLLFASLCLLAAAMPVSSEHERDFGSFSTPFIDHRTAPSAGLSLDQAVQRVRRDTGGRVLAADTVEQDTGSVHRIKVLLPSGRVRVVNVDAEGR